MRRSRALLFNADTQKLELLLTPLQHLEVSLEASYFAEAIRIGRADLKRLHITALEPYFYLSTGYGTVAGTTSIAFGFYDCSDLLRELNHELRGWQYSNEDIINLVRHELGHAFSYAYKLYTRQDFRRIFNVKGHYFHTYPLTDRYVQRVNPWSRDFVNPSGDHYAQKHPDEDFAETFTVLMQPHYNWERAYRNYPGALKKLRFAQKLIKELGRKPPLVTQTPYDFEPLSDFKMTLAQFFKLRSTRPYRKKATGFIDPDLLDLFWRPAPIQRNNRKRERDYVHADNFIRKHKRDIVTQVSRWTGASDLVVKDLLDKCGARSHALGLWVRKDKREAKLVELTSFISYRCALYALNESYMNGRR